VLFARFARVKIRGAKWTWRCRYSCAARPPGNTFDSFQDLDLPASTTKICTYIYKYNHVVYIYIIIIIYIYSYYPPIWSYPKYHQLSNFLGKIGALMMSPKSKVVFDTAFQAIQTGENGLGCHHQKKKWNLFCFKTRLPLRFKCLN
jgi:hypothetical protein